MKAQNSKRSASTRSMDIKQRSQEKKAENPAWLLYGDDAEAKSLASFKKLFKRYSDRNLTEKEYRQNFVWL